MHSRDTAIQEESIQVLQNGSPLQVSIAITLSQEEEGTENIGCLYCDVIKFIFFNIFENCLELNRYPQKSIGYLVDICVHLLILKFSKSLKDLIK